MKSCISIFFLLVLASTAKKISATSSDTVETETLIVKKIHDGGFGCRHNMYAWSMETFKDKLYVGTLNVKGKALGMNLFLFGVRIVLTHGGEIHQGTRAEDGTWTWERVVTKGLLNKRHFGFRKFLVAGDYLYAVSANHSEGFVVVRTQDGENWGVVSDPGYGNRKNTSGRGMAIFQGYLYIGVENRREGAEIWRHSIEDDGALSAGEVWEKIVDGGMNDINNLWFSDFLEYNGQLYTGTLHPEDGAQLWRSANGVDWVMVWGGGYGIQSDIAIMKLVEFDGQMYVGTMNYDVGASLLVSTNSETNSTADEFTYVYTGGNGEVMNVYTWYMIEYEGLLYIGTFHAYGQEEFDLYSSADPVNTELTVETTNAFGNNNIYGIRSMAVYQDKLIIGSASNNKPLMIFEATAKKML